MERQLYNNDFGKLQKVLIAKSKFILKNNILNRFYSTQTFIKKKIKKEQNNFSLIEENQRNYILNFNIILKSFDDKSLNFAKETFLKNILQKKYLSINIMNLPIRKKSFTVLSSPHVNKKARDQYEQRIYSLLISIKINSTLLNKTFLKEFLQLFKQISSNILIQYSLTKNFSSVAQRQSKWLLTIRSLVRSQPEEMYFYVRIAQG